MGRPLAITKRQAASLLKAAEENHAVIEVQTSIGVVRLIPQSLAKEPAKDEEVKGHF